MSFLFKAALLALALSISSCTTSTPIHGPDGNAYHFIECNGLANPMSSCYKKASATCLNGYKLINAQNINQGTLQTSNSNAFVTNVYGHSSSSGRAIPVVQKNITIQCKEQ